MSSDLLLPERQEIIRRRLADQGRVIAAELAQEFAISEDTVRRDLREMAAAGLCRRVYGGALLATVEDDNTLTKRMSIKPERKKALAKAAVSQFQPNMTVFIDAGTTNLSIAEAIPTDLPLTVITNAPTIAAALLDRNTIDVVVIGGRLDGKSGGVLGARAMQDAALFRPDLCVLGSCGLDPENGVTASFYEEAEFKRFVAERSRGVMAAVTSEKLGVPAAFAVVPLEIVSHLVVEHDADSALVKTVAGARTQVIRAEAE